MQEENLRALKMASEAMLAIETLRELDQRGYRLAPKTRVEVHEQRVGAHSITYADRLLVSGGPGPLDEALRDAVRRHQPHLLAAALVRRPPTDWAAFLVSRCHEGRVPLKTLSANVAAFMYKSPIHDGLLFEGIIKEVLG